MNGQFSIFEDMFWHKIKLTVPLIFDVIGRQCLLNVCSDKPYKSFDVSSYFRKKTNNGTFIETVIGHYQPCINGSSGWSTNVVIWMVPFDVSLTISLSSNSFDLKVLKLALILERTNNGTFIETVTYSSFDIWCDWETVSFESMFWQTIQILWCYFRKKKQ